MKGGDEDKMRDGKMAESRAVATKGDLIKTLLHLNAHGGFKLLILILYAILTKKEKKQDEINT